MWNRIADVLVCALLAGFIVLCFAAFAGCATNNKTGAQIGFQPLGQGNKVMDTLRAGDDIKNGTKLQDVQTSTNTGTQIVMDGAKDMALPIAGGVALVFALLWLYGRFDRLQDDLRKAEIEAAKSQGQVRGILGK